jgi:Tol biopolymer transport system component
MDTQGENSKQLTFVDGKDTVLWPSWSPISDTIAFSYNKAGDEIDFRLQVIKSDGTGQKEILSSNDRDLNDHEPAWSPDGKTLYFLSNRTSQMEIWKLDYEKWEQGILENKKLEEKEIGLKLVSHLSSVNVNPDHRPRVSPDGKKIVFYGVGSDWNNIGTNLYTLNIDGTELTNVTKSIDGNEWPDW